MAAFPAFTVLLCLRCGEVTMKTYNNRKRLARKVARGLEGWSPKNMAWMWNRQDKKGQERAQQAEETEGTEVMGQERS